MFDYVISSILKNKSKSILLIVGLAALVCMVISISGIVSYQIDTMKKHASSVSGRIIVQSKFSGIKYPPGSIDLKESGFTDIKNSLECFQKELTSPVLFYSIKEPEYPTGPPMELLVGIQKKSIKSFTGAIANETKPYLGKLKFKDEYSVIIGSEIFKNLKKTNDSISINSKIDLFDHTFTIVAILEPSSTDKMVDNSYIIPLKTAQIIFDKKGMVSSFIMTLKNVNILPEIVKKIKEFNKSYSLITNKTMAENVRNGMKLFSNMVNSISIVVTLVAILLLITVMLTNIRERTREIGILRALGMNNFNIIRIIFLEIITISTIGAIPGGIIAGLILKYAMLYDLFNIFHVLKIIPLSIIIAILSTIFPAIKILKIDPIRALQYE